MPIIDLESPWTAASNAVGAYTEQKNKNEAETYKRKTTADDTAYKHGEDAKADLIARQNQDRQDLDSASTRETQAQDRNLAAAQEKTRLAMAPILLAIQKVTLQNDQLDTKKKAIDLISARADAAFKTLQTQLEQQFGKKNAEAALAQARAQVQATLAQAGASAASANNSNANAEATRYGMAHGLDEYHAPASKTTTSDKYQALPLAQQKLVDAMLNAPDKKAQLILLNNAHLSRADSKYVLSVVGDGAPTQTSEFNQVNRQNNADQRRVYKGVGDYIQSLGPTMQQSDPGLYSLFVQEITENKVYGSEAVSAIQSIANGAYDSKISKQQAQKMLPFIMSQP